MLIKIGNSVVSTDDLLYAFINGDGVIECRFREGDRGLLVDTSEPEADLAKLQQASTEGRGK